MRKGLKITFWILGLLAVLLLAGLVALQSPAVQTALGRRIVGILQKDSDASIEFKDISVRPLEAILLKDLVVRDNRPALPELDTILYVDNLSVKFSLRGLINGKGAYVSRLRLAGGGFNLVMEPDPDKPERTVTNLERAFGLISEKTEKTEPTWGNLLTARVVELENITFRMENLPLARKAELAGESVPEGVIDWNHLSVLLERAHIENLKVAENHITSQEATLQFLERATGMHFNEVHAKRLSVGEKLVDIRDLHINDGYSDVNLEYLRLEGSLDEYDDFTNKVVIDGVIRDGSLVDLGNTVAHFSSLETTFRGIARGHVRGTVNDIHLDNVTAVDPDNGIRVNVSGTIRDVELEGSGTYDINVREIDFDLDGLAGFVHAWAPETQLDLKQFAPGERLNFEGRVQGPLNDLGVNGQILSNLGGILADVYIRNVVDETKDLHLGGQVATISLDLGRILGTEDLGPLSMRTSLDAALKDDGKIDLQVDTLRIAALEAKGYTYRDISARGSYKNESLQAALVSLDPNLLVRFNGRLDLGDTPDALYRFDLNVENADLDELHLDNREVSGVKFSVNSDLRRSDARHLDGVVTVADITLQSKEGVQQLGNLFITAHQKDTVHTVNVSSGILTLQYKGSESILNFTKDVKDLVVSKELPALGDNGTQNWSGASYSLALQLLRVQELLGFFDPGLYVEKNTEAQITVDRTGLLTAQVTSGRLAHYNRYIRDFQLNANNRGRALEAIITGSTLDLGGRRLLNNRFDLRADDNQVDLGYTFDNKDDEKTYGAFNLTAGLEHGENGLEVTGRVKPSHFRLGGDEWKVESKDIFYAGGDVEVGRLQATHERQALLIDGAIKANRSDTLHVNMDHFDLDILNTFTGGTPELAGLATGHAMIISPTQPSLGLLANIQCDSTYVSGEPLGTLHIYSTYEEQNKRFAATLRNSLNGRSSLDAQAYLAPSSKDFSASARLDGFNLGYIAPFLTDLFSRFGGSLGGQVEVSGQLGSPLHFASKDLELKDGLLELEFTRVPYLAEGKLEIKDKGLYFAPLQLSDGQKGKGTVQGALLFNDFKNLGLDIHVQVEQMHALNTPNTPDQSFFGNLYADGRVDVTGDLNRITLAIDATTRSGELHVPLGSVSGESSRELLTFTEPAQEQDPYERMMASRTPSGKQVSDLIVELRAHATPDAIVYIDVDNESSLQGSGNGTIDLMSRSRTGQFTMNGNYTLTSGNFHFSAMSLVSRDFTIQDGSSVRFNGDVMDTDLNVHGLYVTKASLYNLTADESASTRRTVNCGIDITGKLRNPELHFSIDIPDLNPTVQAQVEAAFNTEDKIQKQFIYLLVAGSFLPSEESGISVGGSDVLFSNVSSIMSGQLNNIFQKLDIPLDLGLNYKSTQYGSNIFDVAVSTQLFNNRVIVNGSVGNRERLGTTTNEVAGNVDAEIKLTRNGALRLNLFTHAADQLSSFLDNSQRHGAGIAYQMEFNTFAQLFRELFSTRAEKEQRALEEAKQVQKEVKIQIDTTGKAHVQR